MNCKRGCASNSRHNYVFLRWYSMKKIRYHCLNLFILFINLVLFTVISSRTTSCIVSLLINGFLLIMEFLLWLHNLLEKVLEQIIRVPQNLVGNKWRNYMIFHSANSFQYRETSIFIGTMFMAWRKVLI